MFGMTDKMGIKTMWRAVYFHQIFKYVSHKKVYTVQPTYTDLCNVDIPLNPTAQLSPNSSNAKILRNLRIFRLYKVSPSAISTEFEAKVIGDRSTSAGLQHMDKFAFQWKATLLVCQSIDLANNTQNCYRDVFIRESWSQTSKCKLADVYGINIFTTSGHFCCIYS